MTEQRPGLFRRIVQEPRSLYIARPDVHLNDLIYKHPDTSIPRGAKLTVRASECALFFREGRCIGRIDPGTVALDTANIPFLGHIVVNSLTGGNHFLCELFFVSTKETVLNLTPRTLGQYRDVSSANVVNIAGAVSLTVKVQDPQQLVIGLAGQSSYAEKDVIEVLSGRLHNLLRQVVGRRARSTAVLDIVSNVDAEAMSDELREISRTEFADLGVAIGRMFDLALSLDDLSTELLRAFGKQQSELILAKDESFVQANVIKGQRAAMEGLARGLESGNGALIMSGGIGSAFQPPPIAQPRRPAPRPPGGAILSTQATFVIVGATGESGPYSARQLALVALSKGQPLREVLVRRTDDPPDVTFTADLEPTIVAEYQRRAPQNGAGGAAETARAAAGLSGAETPSASNGGGDTAAAATAALDAALLASAVDGGLAATAVDILARMAVGLGLAPNEAAGRAVVLAAAARLGVRLAG